MKFLTKTLTATAIAVALLGTSFATGTATKTPAVDSKGATTASQTKDDKMSNTKQLDLYTKLFLNELKFSLDLTNEELEIVAKSAAEFAKNPEVSASKEDQKSVAEYLQSRASKVMEAKVKTEGEKQLKIGKEALEKFAKEANAVKDPSGIVYVIEKQGTGAQVKDTDTVTVAYKGTLVDGTVFDQNDEATFSLKQLIPGFRTAATKLKVGGTINVLIPANLAYGVQGAGTIPPNATIRFVFTIKDAKPEEAAK